MRILIVGAGATGGYFGARLAQAGCDVTFLVRERRFRQLKENGLVLRTPQGVEKLQPQLAQAGSLSGTYDLIILTVKSFGLAQAIEDIAPVVGEQTLIMPILNGMRHIDRLRERFGDKAIGGLVKINATLGEQGEVVQMTPLHQIYYGALDGHNDARLQRVDEALRAASVDTFFTDNIISELWEKWLLLSTLGAVCCLARGDTQQVLTADGGEALLRGIFSEVLATITADGYQPRPAVTAKILELLNNPATPMTSSMYRDLTQGYDIEAEQVIGDLVERAARHGVSVPLLNAVNVNLQVYLKSR
ncbi:MULTISPECIES: ketopantoate reductase family protein [Pantoea]|jgi:2-dehydropantoate 2-reductase|uniref:ketopantoate reductase family protein n=1 Tax=Pantoea TaxID=53335 RepID=UPI000EA07839|nr:MULTISPECIES: ketopantoate reductase family protein [Pantoea]MBZ6388361.1 ketopantoate reductase family protein [Pantoea piersonii]MBZ6401910.1 ketopantoate reductase family protein [Pantoea piersonii]MBZ6408094.1 ketopantoate reductase family protein [Pantoea piersonii]MBZ6428708.1 ketopantoate reductase family protein [Pantoea piersonii]NYB00842.1 ketopantoate reductase family protein [Pantoea piersonii]